jgi:hypothetical protein
VSHQPERKQKDCLNCGTIVHGRYCHKCGQENIETKETLWGLVHHFIEDITHFDSKFFDTLRYIIFKPGYLSLQYMHGRRASFLNPIRMYLFTSALFFLIFSFQVPAKYMHVSNDKELTLEERKESIKSFKKDLKKDPNDSLAKRNILLLQDTTRPVAFKDLYLPKTSVSVNGKSYKSVQEYDSLQNALPKEKRDAWLKRIFTRKSLELVKKYNNDLSTGIKDFAEAFLHRLPYLLFLSLPFFALIL